MNSTDLPSWVWRDPLEVAARREAMSCVGCLFRLVVLDRPVCAKFARRGGEKMYRCGDYQEMKR